MSRMPHTYKVLIRTVAVAASVVFLAAVLVVVISCKVGLEDFPEWLEALSTFAAFTAATIAIWSALEAFKLESKREAQFQEDQRRAQASKVAGWATKPLFHDEWDTVLEGAEIKVRNASDVPVTDIQVVLFRAKPLADGGHELDYLGAQQASIVTPDEPTLLTIRGQRLPNPPAMDPTLRIALSFRDASGRRWDRDTLGNLREGGPYTSQLDGSPIEP